MRSASRTMPWIVGGLTGLSVGLIVLLVVMMQRHSPSTSDLYGSAQGVDTVLRTSPSTAEFDDSIAAGRSEAIVAAAQRVSPVVVSINTVRVDQPRSPVEFFAFLRNGSLTPRAGLGSGVLVDHRGYVLTAAHVVENSERLNITLQDGQTFAAEVVGTSRNHDLAVVKIQGDVKRLPVAALGDSDALRNGQWAIAIGSPFGHLISDTSPTVTVGVISAVHRDVRQPATGPDARERIMFDMIQTDAAINPGNSGGPLVNARGEVIGINTAVISDASGKATGLGFAVPINRARWVMEEIREYGRVREHTLGIRGLQIDSDVRRTLELSDEVPDGWLVTDTEAGQPGARAGLKLYDVITHVDGSSIADPGEVARLFFEARVGQRLRLTIWREGRSFDVDLTLADVDADSE